MAAIIAASLGAFGCNSLTDASGVDFDEAQDTSGDEPTLSSAVPGPADIQCSYPVDVASWGVGPGNTVPKTVQWFGFVPGVAEPTAFGAAEFYNCDGSADYHAVGVLVGQYG